MKYLISLMLIFLLISPESSAQQNSAGGIDYTWMNFGFALAYNSNSFRIVKKTDFRDRDSLLRVDPVSGPGFNLGPIANLKLTKNMDLRFTPVLSFTERSVAFTYANPDKNIVKPIESTYVDLPLSLKIKSIRHRNVRFFLIGGVKYSLDVVSQKKFNDQDLPDEEKKIKLIKNVYSYEFGCGFDLYYPYFKFSPELKFTNGFNNILVDEKNNYSSVIDQLFSRVFQLTFYFE